MGTFEVAEKVYLEPCPFCGGEAYITGLFIPTDGGEINAYAVGCEKCKISFMEDWLYDNIVKKWNTRIQCGGRLLL